MAESRKSIIAWDETPCCSGVLLGRTFWADKLVMNRIHINAAAVSFLMNIL
jgi:hypothetical protein